MNGRSELVALLVGGVLVMLLCVGATELLGWAAGWQR